MLQEALWLNRLVDFQFWTYLYSFTCKSIHFKMRIKNAPKYFLCSSFQTPWQVGGASAPFVPTLSRLCIGNRVWVDRWIPINSTMFGNSVDFEQILSFWLSMHSWANCHALLSKFCHFDCLSMHSWANFVNVSSYNDITCCVMKS